MFALTPTPLLRSLFTALLTLGVTCNAAAQDAVAEEPAPATNWTLEDADDALFDGEHARALEIYVAIAEGSGWTAGEAALAAAKLYATGRGTPKAPDKAAEYFGRAFDETFEAALEAQAAGEAGASTLAKLDATLSALANRFATGEQVERDFQRAVDMDLRLIEELLSGGAVNQMCIHYSNATPEEARYIPGREFIVSYSASLALALMAGEVEEDIRPTMLNNLGEMRRGGADRADGNLEEAKSQPFPVSYAEAFWAYQLAAEEFASGTAMYSLGVMHYRAMGLPDYWIDGADSPAVRFRKERARLEAAREWFRKAIVNGDPEGETWFVGVSQRLLDLVDQVEENKALARDVEEILQVLRAEPGFGPEDVTPATWAGVEDFRARAG